MDVLADFRMIVRCFITKQRMVLVALILMSMSLNQAFAATTKNSAAECFKLAEQYEKEANKYANDESDPYKWFDLAMENYMCAYKAGNRLAGFRAMQLSRSDNVEPLSKEMENRLLFEAAEADIADAQIALASIICGKNIWIGAPCKSPQDVEKWLLRAAKTGSADGAFVLGIYIEEQGGEKIGKTSNALACYKLAQQRYQEAINAKDVKNLGQMKLGIENTKRNIDRVQKTLNGNDPLGKCY